MDRTKLLVVVDMQNDFINGSLGSEDAKAIIGKVCDKIDNWDGYVCFTMDTHYDNYLETVEGKHIPVEHCMNDTPGWQLHPEIAKRRSPKAFTYYKESFGTLDIEELIRCMGINQIQIVGLCTDICVVSNALILRSAVPDADISVDASCCAGTTIANHVAALTVMKQCCIDVINEGL